MDDDRLAGVAAALPGVATDASTASVLIERIAWLIRLRWVAVIGVVGAVEFAERVLGIPLRRTELYAVVVALACYNTLVSWTLKTLRRPGGEAKTSTAARMASLIALAPVFILILWLKVQNTVFSVVHVALRQRDTRSRRRQTTLRDLLVPRTSAGLEKEWDVFQAASLASAQISVDLVALATLLHYAGGIENPFRAFFIFHVILSSMLLSRRATLMQAALGWLLMAGVALGESTGLLTHYPLAGIYETGAFRSPTFVFTQLIVLALTLGLSAYMAGDTSRRLRQRERETTLLARALAHNASLLEAAYQDLRATERAKSQYMRKVAHELRGPLGTIRTALRVVLDGLIGEVSEGPRTLIERAERRAAELAQVTADLLALSQARDVAISVTRAPVDVAALLAEVVTDATVPAREAGIDLRIVVEGQGPLLVEGDLPGLREMARNLVANAVRYTPRGGRVLVSLAGTQDEVLLTVTDTGIGIPAEDLPRIFEEFFRSARARDHSPEGTGLGLAIVKAVVDKHQGKITVDSAVGQGTTFRVALPRTATLPQTDPSVSVRVPADRSRNEGTTEDVPGP